MFPDIPGAQWHQWCGFCNSREAHDTIELVISEEIGPVVLGICVVCEKEAKEEGFLKEASTNGPNP